MSKYYAVKVGRIPGIYRTWTETESLVKGFPGAKYKSFTTEAEAKKFLNGEVVNKTENKPEKVDKVEKVNKTGENVASENVHELVIYTDGSCVNEVGGYGFVTTRGHKENGKVPSYPTTNNVAELYAIQETLKYVIKNKQDFPLVNEVIIYSDSKYSIGCLTQWCFNWKRNGWVNAKKEPVVNQELIKYILALLESIKLSKSVEFRHVVAHRGNHFNAIADSLADEGRNK